MEVMQKPKPGYENLFPDYPEGHIRLHQERIGGLPIKNRKNCLYRQVEGKSSFNSYQYDEKAKYPNDMLFYPERIKIGQKLDVIHLLSTYGKKNKLVRSRNGDQVNIESALRGKYIMICCFFVPYRFCSFYSDNLAHLSNLSDELSVRDDFELVVVAKMRRNWANDEYAFERFISAFSCLVVPFSESKSRDYICKSLNLVDKPKCYFLNPNQEVQRAGKSILYGKFGGNAFPFTVKKLRRFCNPSERLSLEGLLGCKCNPSDYTLYKNPGGGSESIRLSELKEKVVGLYLCNMGVDILKVWEVYQQCRKKGLVFEIVLVYMPVDGLLSEKLLQDLISDFMQKHKISWWVLPFNYSVCTRLKNMSELYIDDGLIIVGPRDKYVDLHGRGVLVSFGVDAYPFTREHIVQKELQRIKGFTLKSVLDVGSQQSCEFIRINSDDITEKRVVHLADLNGKYVLLCVISPRDSGLYDALAKWYKYTMKTHPTGFEVVVVLKDPVLELESDDYYLKQISHISEPWLICPVNISHLSQSRLVSKRLFNEDWSTECLVLFGEDAKICSFTDDIFPSYRGTAPFPFVADMRKDVITKFSYNKNLVMVDMLH